MTKEKKRKSEKDEDPLEKEKRKAAKKAEKVAKVLGYSNDVNPFGDSNLLQPFVWGKKREKDKKEGKKDEDKEEKRLKLMDEIYAVRKRRQDREMELEEMERLRTEEQRLREAVQFGDWQKKEEEYHIEQTRVRSMIRLLDKREKPIDIIAKNILLVESVLAERRSKVKKDDIKIDILSVDVEIRDPVSLVECLDVEQLEEIIEDIDNYIHLSRKSDDAKYQIFWESLRLISISRLANFQSQRHGSVHRSLVEDVERLLSNKSDSELEALEADVRKDLREGKCMDATYWEEIVKEISLQIARNKVKAIHQSLVKRQQELLREYKKEHNIADADVEEIRSRSRENTDGNKINPNDEQLMRSEIDKGMDESESKMAHNDEIDLPSGTYWWADRYRPRKPRYFNRVRTGWDWNKYNQTHYDQDNPPPKTVQGYKFAIFYPDLIDKSVSPRYFLEGTTEKEFAILRFHAGAPYEDLAFKIINKEWDINRRSGFKCTFEGGVLQLHFNFKRQWYRR